MTTATELVESASDHGARFELDPEWKNLLFFRGPAEMPSDLYKQLKSRREEIAAYLVGRELKN